MANEVNLKIKITDDGSLNIVAKEAKKATKETEKLGRASESTKKKRDNYSKGEKGVAGATANSTKAFSKMRESMTGGGGLVPAYATLAANVFALSAAFGVLQRAAQLEQLKAGFEALANTSGRTASLIVNSITSITDGAVSMDQAFRSAAAGFNAGFSTREIERLTLVAKNASQALGRNLPDSLDRLIRGTAKLEPEILDELGIFVRLDDAVRRYSQSLGKAAGELTDSERRQAFLNASLTQGEMKFAALGDSIPANPFEQLAANFDALSKSFLNIVGTVLGPIVSVLSKSTLALVGVLLMFGSTISKQIFPVLGDLGGKYRDLAADASQAAATAKKEQKDLMKGARQSALAASPINQKSKFAKIQEKLRNKEKVSIAELNIAQKSLMKSEESRARNLDKYTGDQLSAKEQELQAIKRQKAAVEDLIAAEQGRTGPQLAKTRADKLGSLEGGVTKATEDIQKAGALDGFTLARKGLKDYTKDVDLLNSTTTPLFVTRSAKANKIIEALSVKLRVGSVAVRLFGAAFINAIPFIGQIVFVLGLAITGIKALANAVMKPSKALEELIKVVDSAKEKAEQLAEANAKLESKYYAILLAEEQTKKETKELTKERLLEIQATAKSFAGVEKYANSLKVTSGITKEFASAIDGLAQELRDTEPGFLGSLLDYVVQGTLNIATAAVDGLTMAFHGLKDAITDNAFTRAFGHILDGFGYIGTKLFPDTARSIDIAPVVRKTEKFKDTVLDQFEELKENAPAAAKAMEKSLGTSFDSFVESQFAGVEASQDYAAAQLEFERATVAVSGALKLAALESENSSQAFSKFAENSRQASVSIKAMEDKFFKKGEYGQIAEELTNTTKAIKKLREAADEEGSGTSFGAAIERAVSAGEIDLGSFGLTLEEVKEKGESALEPLLKNYVDLDAKTRENAQQMKIFKASLDEIKAGANLRELALRLNDVKEGLRLTGNAAQMAGRGLSDVFDKRDSLLQDIQDEAKIRREMVNHEIDLEILKLEVLKTSHSLTEGQIALVDKLIQNLETSRLQRDAQITTETGAATTQVDLSTVQEAEQLRNKLLEVAKAGDTTAARIANLGFEFEAMGGLASDTLSFKDEEGNIVGSNFAGKVQMVTDALQPMIKAFAELGPDGKVAQAFAEGMVVMSQAAAALGDSIERNLSLKATDSISSFKTAWEGAEFEEKAAVASAAFAMAAASIGALAGALREQANSAIAKIDEQIEREKKLDGKSAASVAKIKKLEADKEKTKKKAFETDKKLRLAQAVASTAAGVAGALSLAGKVPPGFEIALAGMIGAMGLAQIAIISGLSYGGGASGSSEKPSSISVGKRSSSIDLASSQGGAGELAYMRGGKGIGGPENFKPAFAGYRNRAEGGNTAFMVGEQGPELFVPEKPGRIVPNDDVQASTPVNANINISAIDAAGVEDVLINQRGNIISMIREAANAQGNTFLEEVNVAEL